MNGGDKPDGFNEKAKRYVGRKIYGEGNFY